MESFSSLHEVQIDGAHFYWVFEHYLQFLMSFWVHNLNDVWSEGENELWKINILTIANLS